MLGKSRHIQYIILIILLMWRADAYQIPYYSRGIEEAKRTHPRFADWDYDLNENSPEYK
jgi:hypothetical protein